MKTKSFKKYLEKRLTPEEIKEIENEAYKEVKKITITWVDKLIVRLKDEKFMIRTLKGAITTEDPDLVFFLCYVIVLAHKEMGDSVACKEK